MSLRFFDVPIFGLPYFEFPLGRERRSGWLNPSLGYNSNQGYGISIPYYFNLAHNFDATLTPRLMTRRGLQLTGDARYVLPDVGGNARLDWLPYDTQSKTSRWGAFSHHNFARGEWSAGLDVERVSDNLFFANLSKTSASANQTALPSELWARYQPAWGEVSIRASQFQTLQDATNSIVPAYARLPVMSLSTKPIKVAGFDLRLDAQATHFTHPTLVQGNRAYIVPQISRDWVGDWGYIKPTLALNSTAYSGLNAGGYGGATPNGTSFSRTLPMFSVDSGVTLERKGSWLGQPATQTLEPRLYFLYVPFKDQAAYPNFDTSVSGFGFSQIFSNNVFTGQDRIADAQHLTPALSSRWLDAATGTELFKITAGKRFYFSPQKVQLTGPSLVNSAKSSDWLAAASGTLTGGFFVDAALQYDQVNRGLINNVASLRYNPEPRRIVTLSRSFTKNAQDNVDLSWQWRFSPTSAILGRLNYARSVPNVNTTAGLSEALLGYEYNADCWSFRIAANRYTPLSGNRTTGVYFQLEFAGLSQFGAGALDTLKRNIPGYTPFESKPTWSYDAFRPF